MNIQTVLLTTSLLVASATAGLAQGLTPQQQAQGAALRAQIRNLESQWQAQTGQSLLAPGQDDVGGSADPTYQRFQSAMGQLGGVNPSTLYGRGGEQEGNRPDAALNPGTRRSNPVTSGTPDFSPATNAEGWEKIPAGFIASGSVTMTTNSDSPGPFRGTLDQPILSIDGRHVLFPQGSTIVGRVVRITGVNEAINRRLGFIPTYLVRPNGEAMKLRGNNILDQAGINGVADEVNYHVWIQLGAVVASAAVTTAPVIANNLTSTDGNNSSSSSFATGSILTQGNYAIQNQISRYLQLMPTITVNAGMPIRIFFNEEQYAPPLRPRDNFNLTNINSPVGPSQGRAR